MSSPQPAAAAPRLSPRLNSVAHAWMATPVYQLLLIEAERRGEHPDRLTSAIMNVVLQEGWTDTLLDR